MEYKRFGGKLIVRIDKGEEILSVLNKLCDQEQIKLASVSAIGAVSVAEIGCFDTREKKYYAKRIEGVYELTSLAGTVSRMNEKVYLHTHATLAGMDNTVVGGHLNSAIVGATCEMVVDIIDGQVNRVFSEEIGLNLISFK